MIHKVEDYAEQLVRMQTPKNVIDETTRIFDVLPETSSQLSDLRAPGAAARDHQPHIPQ